MGRERTRDRQYVLLYIACLIISFLAMQSCSRVPVLFMEKYHFNDADTLIAKGRYKEALVENRRILSDGPKYLGDQALYRIGLILIHEAENSEGFSNAREYFQHILDNYPESSLEEKAKLWIRLIDVIENTETEIARLKDTCKNTEDVIEEMETEIARLEEKNENSEYGIEKRENEINLLNKRITELVNQIENLKQIDLGVEQKKRKGVP